MFLSIIIPTWKNTEAELIRCMDSIYQSPWRDFEVLVVDDGNETAYGAMLDELAARYPITVIHVPHGGVSAARNLGVKQSKGNYVLFVDADDVLTQQFWIDTEKIKEKGLSFDIIYGLAAGRDERQLSFVKVCEDFEARPLDEKARRALYRQIYAPWEKLYATEDGSLSPGPWARLVRKKFLLHFPFDTKVALGEDVIWNLDMLKADPQVCVIRHVWYYTIGNPNSATRGYRDDIAEQRQIYLRLLKKYILDEDKEAYLIQVFHTLKEIADKYYLSEKNPLSWRQKVEALNRMTRSNPFNELLKPDVKTGGVKLALKLVLCRTGLLLYACKLKMLLRR